METDCARGEAPVNNAPIGSMGPIGPLAALPAGTRLLHIGPHKTGTTAIQGALFAAKDMLPEHGVEFPATSRHPMEAALAASPGPR